MMSQAHQHTEARPTRLEQEVCEHFARLGFDVTDCETYLHAHAARCLECQDALLADVAADPRRTGVLFQLFSLTISLIYGQGTAAAIVAKAPAVEAVAMRVARTLVGTWGDSTPGIDDAVDGAVEALAEVDTPAREQCLQAQANLIAAGQDPLLRAMTEAGLDDRVDMHGQAHWIR